MAMSVLDGRPTVIRRWNAFPEFMTLVLVVLSCWIQASDATSLHSRHHHPRHLRPRAPIAGGVELRVLPIGDSITFGSGSSDWNGYREMLYKKLIARGNKVDFVGGVPPKGDMADGDSEGHRGYVIDQIADESGIGIAAAPNIVLLHAGTNDMNKGTDIINAPSRLKNLMTKIFKYSPDAVIFLCQIVPSKADQTEQRIQDFNHEIPRVANSFSGKKVVMVNMHDLLDRYDLDDDLHPNDVGFEKMADAFYAAIEQADNGNLITEPGKGSQPPDATSPSGCKSTPSWYNAETIASGAKVAEGDGDFSQAWYKIGVVAEGACPRHRLHFMDLNGDGLKDYACVDAKTGATTVHINVPDQDGKANGNWQKPREIATGREGRLGSHVMFADLNGDGMDDYIYLDSSDGNVYGWINRGDKNDVWQWQSIGKIAGGVGAANDTLQMADIDGDGRDDFLLVDTKSGSVKAWLNTGAGSIPDYHKIDEIATGASATSGDKVRFGDFTGNGRADYMIIGAGGKVSGLVNRLQEDSLVPRWLAPVAVADGPSGAKQDQVRLVDFTGDGKVDYLLVDEEGKITLWENLGSGGKYQPGEGVILCDLDGDGTKDYFWVDHTGKGYGYLNKGKGTNVWDDLGNIAKGDHDRELVRMGALTKSKRADYIVLDKDSGRAMWYKNTGAAGKWGWGSPQEVATGPVKTLKDKFGIKFNAKNVRFADLDGDDLDDYVYVDNGGATVWWQNRGTDPPSFNTGILVADGPGCLAQEVHFADTNGDGKLDYVVVGRTSGRARSWHHLGFRSEDGSIRWNTPLSFADGPGPTGYNVRIAEMTGDKRADYVAINPDNGRLRLWINRCWQLDYGWETVGCTLPEVENATMSSKERWDAVGADDAFDAMISFWKKEKSKSEHLDFAPACSHFWNLEENMNCHIRTTENGCNDYVKCQDTYRPAGYFIINSFVSVNSILANIYGAVGAARDAVDSDLGKVSTVFQASPPKSADIPLALEIIGLAFAVIGAPIWNSVLKGTAAFRNNPNTLGTIKDAVNGAVQGGLTIAKGRIVEDKVLDVESALGISLSETIKTFYESITDLTAWIFGGSEEGITVLRGLFTDGAMNGESFEPTADIDIQYALEKGLYAVIIPQAWFMSDEPVNPAILETEEECVRDTSPPEGWVATCIDGVFYRLVAGIGPGRHCVKKPCPKPPIPCIEEETCTDNDLSKPPGVDTFGGKKYGGLSHHELIRAAVNTWKKNGKDNNGNSQNGKGLLNPLAEDFDLVELNIETPGVVTIPVCTERELRTTWYKGRNTEERPNFPCP